MLHSTRQGSGKPLGGHTGIPTFAGDDAARFFVRHLKGGLAPTQK